MIDVQLSSNQNILIGCVMKILYGAKVRAVTLVVALLFGITGKADESLDLNLNEGKEIIQAFMGNLQGVLQSRMKSGGPVSAIDACNTIAPQLSGAYSETSAWQVGRTSLKVRNSENVPDAWEKVALEEFDARKVMGEDPMQIVKTEVLEENGQQVFRMMKAIPTGEVCTVCHGSNIAEPVAAKLDELYPNDQARGFEVGDLRGAFSLKRVL